MSYYVVQGASSTAVGQMIGAYMAAQRGKPQHGPYYAFAWANHDGIFAAVLLNDFTGANIEMHVQGKGHFSLKKFRVILNYVFRDLRCKRLTAKQLEGDNHRHLLTRLDFEYEATLRDYYKEGNAQVFVLTAKAAERWLDVRHAPSPAAAESFDNGRAAAAT